ncbi:hypothetical protein BU23DRAFT_285673 [Bimuria novae-zelandiae CBS 107.79]|uniref:F-box domain-containing protein n=1 Tax=Bimuria novae-zelandiae CBS 107.79 TaxID=1447943 RepID=A0A6A5USL0_9PLEO|nr:hypothetical protein BU23DRAFT_285673 [Bimuria novae-zelandiae CBS 107.79]
MVNVTIDLCRHLSSRPISMRILEHLSHAQQGLLFLQATIRHDAQYQPRFTEQFQVSQALRSLPRLGTCDITFLRLDRFHEFIHCLLAGPFAFRSNLKCLRIHVSNPETFSQVFKKEVLETQCSPLNLNRLTLDGFNMQDLFRPVSQFTYVQSLTHLTLWNCRQTQSFFSQLTDTFLESPRLIDLQHLTTNFDHVNQINIDKSLESVFKICELRSVHLTWDYPQGSPITTLAAMPLLAKSLRSLSFHQRSHIHIAEEELPYLGEGLKAVIEPCHNLLQLGIQVNEYSIIPQIWDAPVMRDHIEFWVR